MDFTDADAVYYGTTQADAVYVGDTLLFEGSTFSPESVAGAVGVYLPAGLPASGSISTWTDASSAGHDLTQATGTKQPVVSAGAASFDGVDDFLSTAAFTWAQPAVVSMAFKYRNGDGGRALQGVNDPSGYLTRGDGTTTSLFVNATSFLGTDVTDPETFMVLTVIFNGASTKIRRNGVELTSGDAGSRVMGGLILGAGLYEQEPADIDVKAIACYSAIPSAGDIDSIEAYMADLAGVSL